MNSAELEKKIILSIILRQRLIDNLIARSKIIESRGSYETKYKSQ